jgi:Inner membrane protein YgaP-like, transmembrane domain
MQFLSFMNTFAGRAIRVVAGLLLVAVGLLVGGGVGLALAAFAVLPIATGVFGVCPVNPLVGQPMRACAVPAKRHTTRHA